MNQKIEIKKIKVKNGQELIQKAKEYKNSGGEWKLLEKYWTSPGGQGGRNTNKKYAKWGIIIGSDSQKVEIYSDKVRDEKKGKGVIANRIDEVDSRSELHQLFPEAYSALFSKKNGEKIESLDNNTYKHIKEVDGEYELVRYLVAKNFHHLKQIIRSYISENETKIYNSANRNFSDWVEIVDGQDGNTYLYVGEKNAGGGREIKIGIAKGEFETKNAPIKGSERSQLEVCWYLFLETGQPLTPTEKENYYRSLEETFKEQWPHREKLCRQYWEDMAERMEEMANYWNERCQQKEYLGNKENKEHIRARAWVGEIKDELEQNTKIKTCCDKGCPHYLSIKDYPAPTSPKTGGGGKPTSKQTNQINSTDKNQLLQYFLTYHITKITLDNGQLVVEYDNSQKGSKEVNKSELEKYKELIQNQPKHSISLSDLQNNSDSNSTTKNPDHKLVIGLVLGTGAVIVGGVIAYFIRKRNKK